MRKRIISLLLSVSVALTMVTGFTGITGMAADTARQVEYLDRGLTAVKVDNGVYLSWRLFGTESLEQKYDVYRDGVKVVSALDATNYTDTNGFSYNTYQVVPTGSTDIDVQCKKTEVWQHNYIDIPLDKPAAGVARGGETYTYSVNDTSVADVDGDGEYEYIIKWDPSNSHDNSGHGYTGNVLLDCYKIDGTKLWRIDLGINIRAGAHYTQFIAYDFDGDGKAEMALRTAPGSKDSTGGYVSRVGNNITWGTGISDTSDLRQSGSKPGHIIQGPDWLTMFNGETGVAMETVDYYPQRGSVKSWGDSYGGRSERYLAGVAYLNGKTPSLIMCRGYYEKAAMAAFDWKNGHFVELWSHTYTTKASDSLYGQGNHQISVADLDNDGKDEIVFGSAAMDDNGTVLHNTGHGHGDALHVSDFNNDGSQEIFNVHEDKPYYLEYGGELRRGSDGKNLAKVSASGDTGRGVMANVDDEYAKAHPSDAAFFWCSSSGNVFGFSGNVIQRVFNSTDTSGNPTTVTEDASRPSSYNSFVYWDGDLGRELLDLTRIEKYSVANGSRRLETFNGVHSSNSSKANAALSGDFFGDWREEVAFGTNDNKALRIFTTVTPTNYKLTTLMHDTQYRCAIAWQNVAYNQPPHTSYYIGSLALASGKNYLAPAAGFDTVEYAKTPTVVAQKPDIEEEIIYTVNSFDNGTAGFTSGTIANENPPYNKTLSLSSGKLNFNFVAVTPDPNATPTPTPKPTPEPTPETKPIPANEPEVLINEDFSGSYPMQDETRKWLINIAASATKPDPYTSIPGLELHVGNRASGDSDPYTVFRLVDGVLQVQSGGFAGNNRGPRIKIVTPAIPNGGSVAAEFEVKADAAQSISFNDDVLTKSGAALPITADGSTVNKIKLVVNANGTREIYVNDTAVSGVSNGNGFPVLWAADSNAGSLYIDNLKVMSITPDETSGKLEIKRFDMIDDNCAVADVYNYSDKTASCVVYFAVYNADDTLKAVKTQRVELEAGKYVNLETKTLNIPDGGYAKAFLWDYDQTPYKDSISTKDIASSILDMLTTTAYAADELDKTGTYKIAFDWKPGTNVQITDTDGKNLVTLSKASGGAIKYKTGNGEEKTLNSSLTAANAWFHVDMTFDFTAKTVDISAMDYTNNGSVKTVYASSFAGVNGFLSGMSVNGSTRLDNLTVSRVIYNTPQSLINVNVKDKNNNAVEGATVTIGSKTLATDEQGHAAVKLNSGSYNYSITKAEFKSAAGVINASNNTSVDAALQDGEMKDIYVRAVYNGDIVLGEVKVGSQKENTKYTVADSAKGDMSYTFPTGSDGEEGEDIIPGYEDEAGKSYVFEYDPNKSETVDVNIEEGADTYITLSYTKKLVPTATDTLVTKVLFSDDGYNKAAWTGATADSMVDEETGTKYTNFSNIAANPVTINIPSYSGNLVMEYDIMYKEMSWGGSVFGLSAYNNNTKGVSVGLRASGDTNHQWQWNYGDQKYISYVNGDKGFTYDYNWAGQWAHVILVFDGSSVKATIANKNTGMVYVQDFAIPMDSVIGGAGKPPVTKVEFGRFVKKDNAHTATIGLANFKAYTVGGVNYQESDALLDIPGSKSFTTSAKHQSGMAGVSYDATTLLGAVSYAVCDASDTKISDADLAAQGLALSSSGVLTVSNDFDETTTTAKKVIVYLDGVKWHGYNLSFRHKEFTYGTIKGFGDGTSPFSITNASGYSISQADKDGDKRLLYQRTAGTAFNNNVFLTANLWSGALADDFVFSFDYLMENSQYKGYMYIQDGSGNNMVKMETHVYTPRIKIFSDTAASSDVVDFKSSNGFAKNQWYTFVVHGKNFSTENKAVTFEIYNKGDYDYITNTATGTSLVGTIDVKPDAGLTANGLVLKYQVAQNTGASTTDEGDKQYFDNLAYYYYDYR